MISVQASTGKAKQQPVGNGGGGGGGARSIGTAPTDCLTIDGSRTSHTDPTKIFVCQDGVGENLGGGVFVKVVVRECFQHPAQHGRLQKQSDINRLASQFTALELEGENKNEKKKSVVVRQLGSYRKVFAGSTA